MGVHPQKISRYILVDIIVYSIYIYILNYIYWMDAECVSTHPHMNLIPATWHLATTCTFGSSSSRLPFMSLVLTTYIP